MKSRLLAVVGLLAVVAHASCASKSADTTVTCGPPTEDVPDNLACTGLYSDYKTKTLAPTARPYAPAAALWSDGYDKSRYIALPDGATIDATSIDDWTFPVGTKVWKEFRYKERKIETRLLWKVRADRWVQAAYVWSEDGSSATRGEGQDLTIAGDAYHVPKPSECDDCHHGKKDKLLGFEALSLAQASATGLTLGVLAAENRLSPPPTRTTATLTPGLAYLHVNCGVSCHNSIPEATGKKSTLRLRIGFEEATSKPFNTWELATTTVGVPTTLPGWNGVLRVTPGAPDKSVIVTSMTTQGTGQMPPMMRIIDFAGTATVESWVRTLPPR